MYDLFWLVKSLKGNYEVREDVPAIDHYGGCRTLTEIFRDAFDTVHTTFMKISWTNKIKKIMCV